MLNKKHPLVMNLRSTWCPPVSKAGFVTWERKPELGCLRTCIGEYYLRTEQECNQQNPPLHAIIKPITWEVSPSGLWQLPGKQ